MKQTIAIACATLLLAGCGDVRSQPANEDHNPASQGVVMKIQFERSGGLAGLTTRVNIDADSLPDAERQTLTTLVADAGFFALPAAIKNSASTGADRFNYRVTIDLDGRGHTVETTDGAAPASLIPLLDWLSGAAQRSKTSGGS